MIGRKVDAVSTIRGQVRRSSAHHGVLTLTVVILLVLSFLAQSSAPPLSIQRVDPAADVFWTMATTPAKTYGLAYGDELVWMTPARLKAALDDAVTVGVTAVRLDVSWADVQWNGPDSYNWKNLDRVVAASRARGLTLLPVLAYTPPWARPAGCSTVSCAPKDPRSFAKFAELAVKRYKTQGVHHWEIWNEPNSVGAWSPAPNAAAYALLLKLTAKAIRAVDPAAFIVMGGLSDVTGRAGNITPTDFLARLSWLGGNRLVDAVAYHPYTYPYLASYRPIAWTSPWDLIDRSRESLAAILRTAGTPRLPIWLTEYGAPSGGPGAVSDGRPTRISAATDHVTENRQAVIAADVVSAAAADPHVGALFWYSQRDRNASRGSNENFYGLRRFDGSPKPAFASLRAALEKLKR